MKITGFKGENVNGYLDFEISFHTDLTFVTGINGTGKTSVLNSIVALLLPKLDYLAGDYFDSISIDVEHEHQHATLSAVRKFDGTVLSCSLFPDEELSLTEFERPDSMPLHRMRELEAEYYKELLAINSKNPVLGFINDLPTPMYLGLDRRTVSVESDSRRLNRAPVARASRKNIFARSLGESLEEALYFAQEQYHAFTRKAARVDAKFRENLVLALIDFPPISFAGKLDNPTQKEIENIETARMNLQRLPELLNLPIEFITKNVDPMFAFLDEKLAIIDRDSEEVNAEAEEEYLIDPRIEALIDWSYNKTQLKKISYLSDAVSEYNSQSEEVFRRPTEFLEAVNSFLGDSGKHVYFDNLGRLRFFLNSPDEERDIRTLSSGEIQLVVILTHLYFNPEVGQANVFIIDEPELSLHVQWQEKFVDGIMGSSSDTQFILATHSPSIILDRVENCIEVSART